MQDGAPSHTAADTRSLIRDIFKNSVIGKHFDIPWPPYSSDLTPADFLLWPTLKRSIFSQNSRTFETISSLKRSITFGFKLRKDLKLRDLNITFERRLNRCTKK